MSDRDASISDAAFREALDALVIRLCAKSYNSYEEKVADVRLALNESRVLALYAERQGEVYEVRWVGNSDEQYGTWHDLELFRDGQHTTLIEGDRVRVVKEGAMTPERERLVRAVEEAHAKVGHPGRNLMLKLEADAERSRAVAALAAYDAAHPEEAK